MRAARLLAVAFLTAVVVGCAENDVPQRQGDRDPVRPPATSPTPVPTPTVIPSPAPSGAPSPAPSTPPSSVPTTIPTPTVVVTPAPTAMPSPSPTAVPDPEVPSDIVLLAYPPDDGFDRLLAVVYPGEGTATFVGSRETGGAVSVRQIDFVPDPESGHSPFTLDFVDNDAVEIEVAERHFVSTSSYFNERRKEDDVSVSILDRSAKESFVTTVRSMERIITGEVTPSAKRGLQPRVESKAGSRLGGQEAQGPEPRALEPQAGAYRVEFYPSYDGTIQRHGESRVRFRTRDELPQGVISLYSPSVSKQMDYHADEEAWLVNVDKASLALRGEVLSQGALNLLMDEIVNDLQKKAIFAATGYALTLLSPAIGLPVALVLGTEAVRESIDLSFTFADLIDSDKRQGTWVAILLERPFELDTPAPFLVQARFIGKSFGLVSPEREIEETAIDVIVLNANETGVPRVVSYVLSNQNPAAAESYDITPLISAVRSDEYIVQTTVTGTDDFSRIQASLIRPTSNYRVFVPGAESGVEDTILMQIFHRDDRVNPVDTVKVSLTFS